MSEIIEVVVIVTGIFIFCAFWAMCDFLSEISYRWRHIAKFTDNWFGRMLERSDWINGKLPHDRGNFWNIFHKVTFKLFFDGNHFFRNIPRIIFSIGISLLIHWSLGFSLLGWYLGREFIVKMSLKE